VYAQNINRSRRTTIKTLTQISLRKYGNSVLQVYLLSELFSRNYLPSNSNKCRNEREGIHRWRCHRFPSYVLLRHRLRDHGRCRHLWVSQQYKVELWSTDMHAWVKHTEYIFAIHLLFGSRITSNVTLFVNVWLPTLKW